MTKYLNKEPMIFPMPQKRGGVLDLDIWGRPNGYTVSQDVWEKLKELCAPAPQRPGWHTTIAGVNVVVGQCSCQHYRANGWCLHGKEPNTPEDLKAAIDAISRMTTRCDHSTRIFTVCGGWKCGNCGERLP